MFFTAHASKTAAAETQCPSNYYYYLKYSWAQNRLYTDGARILVWFRTSDVFWILTICARASTVACAKMFHVSNEIIFDFKMCAKLLYYEIV